MSIVNIPEPERPTEALMGERIHNLLWRAKITQTAFAKSLGLSQTAMSRKLRGERAFTLDEILSISSQMGVTLDYLFGKSDDMGPGSSLNLPPSDYMSAVSAEVIDLASRRASA